MPWRSASLGKKRFQNQKSSVASARPATLIVAFLVAHAR